MVVVVVEVGADVVMVVLSTEVDVVDEAEVTVGDKGVLVVVSDSGVVVEVVVL